MDLFKESVRILKGSTNHTKTIVVRRQTVLGKRESFEDIENRLNSKSFKKAFRISKVHFNILYEKVSSLI